MNKIDLLSKFSGSMLAAALGDALGASFYRGFTNVLKYTDDAAMMLVIAEVLIEDEGKIDSSKLAWKFVEAYEKEPWRGYGPGPPRIFKLIKRGEGPLELDKKLYPGGSFGNGGAMRIAPIGLMFYDDFNELKHAVIQSCKPTHNHDLAIEGALIQAASVAEAVKLDSIKNVDPQDFVEKLLSNAVESEIYAEKLRKIPKLLETKTSRKRVVKALGNSVEAFNSVPTAIYCYLREQDPLGSIKLAISLGGDIDTISCMAGAIAGAHRGVEALPKRELKMLENAEYIKHLAEKLYEIKLRRQRELP